MHELISYIIHGSVVVFVAVVIMGRLLEIASATSREAWESFKDHWGDHVK